MMKHAVFLLASAPIAWSVQRPFLVLVVSFSFFALVLAAYAYRVQPLPAFAGLVAQQLLTFCYHILLFTGFLFTLPLLEFVLNKEWASSVFFLLLSVHGLALSLFSPRPLANVRTFLVQWLAYALLSLAVILGAGVLENFVRSGTTLAPPAYDLVRQITAGLAAGLFLISALVLAYRNLRTRQALWFWLFAAAVMAALTVILQYQLPTAETLQISALCLSSAAIILGLLADRVRFLGFESELRRNLMNSVTQWEAQAHRLSTILTHSREAIVHLDLDERIGDASPAFGQLAGASPSELRGRALKAVLPRPFYDALLPAVQEARRERTASLEMRLHDGKDEKNWQVSHAPLFDERDKLQGVHLGLLEVTRHYHTTSALASELEEQRRELRMFQQGVENAAEAIAIADAQYRLLYANDAFVRTTSLSRQEILGRDLQQFRAAPAYPLAEIKRRLAQDKPWRGETAYEGRDGRSYNSELTVLPIGDTDARFLRYLWIERDITARAISMRTQELERSVKQMAKLMKISEDIRLNVSLEVIMQSVANAIHTLGWQRVAVFHNRVLERFDLVASAGFGNQEASIPRKFRTLHYTDFAPYLLETFRLSSSFFIDSRQLSEKRPLFMPRDLGVLAAGEWREHDCLLVPIHARDRYAGMIAVFSPTDGQRPQQQQVRDLEVFADDAAIAIENSRLMALHANNERQFRTLNRIGNAFRAAGTLEQVICRIAAILAEAMGAPAAVALSGTSVERLASRTVEAKASAGTRTWLAAAGQFSRQGQSDGRLITLAPPIENLLARFCQIPGENEIQGLALAGSEAQELAKLWSLRAGAATTAARLKLATLRTRQEVFGCIVWLLPAPEEEWTEEQQNFARDLAAQTALTIDNARLFMQTEEKALALEHANRHISEFLASVSHELRTPLHAILQFSEILLSERTGALQHEQKRQLDIVQRSGKNLLNLINDLLDLSKLEAGKMEASWQAFNPLEMIRETTAAIRPLCSSKGLNLQVQLPSALPASIISDRHLLARVLTNLLGNAVKFTDHGEVTVTAEHRNRVLSISVRDTGKGIPAARVQEIFEPFRQLESSEARKHGGTGLGLAISQKLLGVLGGHIEVRSAEGKGSTFTLKLPLPEAFPAGYKVRRPKTTTPGKAKQNEKKVSRKGLLTKWLAAAQRKNPSILVVEDDENTRYAMQFILEDAGYQVNFSENGEKALMAAQHERPDIILMDIMMPNLDGYQVARMIKAQKQLQHIPLVALTARAMKGDREKALAAGYDDYLTKPFDKKDILEVIARWLEEEVAAPE